MEVFGQPSLIPTATQERALHLVALCGELARTLETIDGVLTARVHVSLPEDNPLREAGPRPEPAAAVLIKARSENAVSADDVRRLVAGSVDGLSPAKVNVVMSVSQGPSAVTVPLAYVGPFRVARQSRTLLLGTMVTALGLLIALAVLLAVVTLRGQRAVRRAQDALALEGTGPRSAGVVAMDRGGVR